MATPNIRGQRLLPSLLDELSANRPTCVLYSFAKTSSPADGFQDVTTREFARAVNRCAWYLEETLGRGENFPTLTYMGPQDIVYLILTLACVKTGYKLFLSSLRNTLDGHLSMFEKTECNVFLLPPNFPLPVVKQILAARSMRVVGVAPLLKWLDDEYEGRDELYPYTKTFAEAKQDPLVVLHTSGSTGLPKTIIERHATYAPFDAFATLHPDKNEPIWPQYETGTRMYTTFPMFHAAGLGTSLSVIYTNVTMVIGPFPPSVETVNAVHVHGNIQVSGLPPTILTEISRNSEYLENLGKLKSIFYGGGPCPRGVGETIRKKVRMANIIAATEIGPIALKLCDPEDWEYLSFYPIGGHEFRQVSDDLYEHFIVRNPKFELFQGVFGTFPELDEWGTSDLYSKHPAKEDVWLHRGRSDDIIVFATGEKLNPLDMEGIILSNPVINGAIIVGRSRFQAALLVELVNPTTTETERQDKLEAIWPTIEEANKVSPAHGRILRNMVILTSPAKPMLRAGKGTVQRTLTIDLYEAEIEAIYAANDEPEAAGDLANGLGDNVEDAIKRIISTATGIDVETVNHDADLFGLGLDSLQVTVITKQINQYLTARGGAADVGIRTVYSHPTIGALVSLVGNLVGGKAPEGVAETAKQKIQRLYDSHTADMPISVRPAEPIPADKLVVLLTGSTGSLGSYILDALVKSPKISRVYCLNRGPGSVKRQQISLAGRGLQSALNERVECLDADICKPLFGLALQDYTKLLAEVTNVIHNAWQVDFHLSIQSYASQIHAVRRFVDFSAHSKFGARIFFVSSIGAVMNWPAFTGYKVDKVPEAIFEDWRVPQGTGYGESKFISERILHVAAKEAGVPSTVCRVGQVAGPVSQNGVWNKQEWVPRLIASSKHLGKLPESLGGMDLVDWIPVDLLGRVIVELASHPASDTRVGADVFHVVNPNQTGWSKLISTVARHLDLSGERIQSIPLEKWVQALRESASKTDDVAVNPATELLEFFEDMLQASEKPTILDIQRAINCSPPLAGVGPVQDEWMENWMRQWAF